MNLATKLIKQGRGSFVICTHGFVKKSQSTPKKEISLAEKEKKKYLQAKKEGKLKHEK